MGEVLALDQLMASRAVWRAGQGTGLNHAGEPSGYATLDAVLPTGGWPRKALTELLLPADGIGEIALLLPALARMTAGGGRVLLVAPPYIPYAPAWQAGGVSLDKLEVVDADPRDALWTFEQCLRSGACAAVLGWPRTSDARALRRLQVAADSGDCCGFALRDHRHAVNASPAALRLQYLPAQDAWQVRKCRGGQVPTQPLQLAH